MAPRQRDPRPRTSDQAYAAARAVRNALATHHGPEVPEWRFARPPASPSHRLFASVALLLVASSGMTALAVHANAQADSAVADLRIAEILVDPPTGQPEFVELWNAGGAAVQLSGWKVQDRLTTPSTFTFPAWSLPAGGRVVVWTGTNATDTAIGPKWRTSTVWNNAGDSALLIDPTGVTVSEVSYGSGTPIPAPARGKAIALVDGNWTEAEPTPGRAPGSTGSLLSLTVANAPPRVEVVGPAAAALGSHVTFTVKLSDDNGDGDVVGWTLQAGSATLTSGAGLPPANLTVLAPKTPGAWTVTLSATDTASARSQANWTVSMQQGNLVVEAPSGGLRFPTLLPGATDVESEGFVTLRNPGPLDLVPRLDVSDFTGTNGAIPVKGTLWYGLTSGPAGSQSTTWRPYEGPLTPLPAMAPNTEAKLSFRLASVPVPLAAGAYGTSFAVTA